MKSLILAARNIIHRCNHFVLITYTYALPRVYYPRQKHIRREKIIYSAMACKARLRSRKAVADKSITKQMHCGSAVVILFVFFFHALYKANCFASRLQFYVGLKIWQYK